MTNNNPKANIPDHLKKDIVYRETLQSFYDILNQIESDSTVEEINKIGKEAEEEYKKLQKVVNNGKESS